MSTPDIPRNTPWHAAYPAPKSEVNSLPRQELLRWLKEGKQAGKDFVLVDVRRNDFEVLLAFDGTGTGYLLILLGWYHSWFAESTCSELVSYASGIVYAFEER